jgi:hypothetical protein
MASRKTPPPAPPAGGSSLRLAERIEKRPIGDRSPTPTTRAPIRKGRSPSWRPAIKEFGFTNPVLTDEQGGILAGHGRVLAAQKHRLRAAVASARASWMHDRLEFEVNRQKGAGNCGFWPGVFLETPPRSDTVGVRNARARRTPRDHDERHY